MSVADGIEVSPSTISKAMHNDGDALFDIAHKYYYHRDRDYGKVIAWSQLSMEQGCAGADTMLGFLYHKGLGVPIDYSKAMEHYLKAAKKSDVDAWFHIGYLFECGDGVPVDKRKALQWYSKEGVNQIHIDKLKYEGYHISREDERKSVNQLIEETENIFKKERQLKYVKIKQEEYEQQDSTNDPIIKQLIKEAKSLKESNAILEQQLKDREHIIGLLKQENQSLFSKQRDLQQQQQQQQQQQPMNNNNNNNSNNKTIELLESLVQSKSNEINFLKEKSSHLEKENQKLKQKIRFSRQEDYTEDNKKRKLEY